MPTANKRLPHKPLFSIIRDAVFQSSKAQAHKNVSNTCRIMASIMSLKGETTSASFSFCAELIFGQSSFVVSVKQKKMIGNCHLLPDFSACQAHLIR